MKNSKKLLTGYFCLFFLVGCSGDFDSITNSYKDVSSSSNIPNSDSLPISDYQSQIYLNAINDMRSQPQDCGVYGSMPAVAGLVWDTGLYRSSYEHSQDMAAVNYFGHTGSGTLSDWTASEYNLNRGSNTQERANSNGYNSITGENIAAGQLSLGGAMSELQISDAHCKNISTYKTYWTQSFGVN